MNIETFLEDLALYIKNGDDVENVSTFWADEGKITIEMWDGDSFTVTVTKDK